MADRLTQLQDCLDQLATQLYASLRYLSTHHPSAPLPLQPAHPVTDTHPAQRPDTPRTFAAVQRELAQDLILKQRQIEYLIGVLPGLDSSERDQEERIRVLEGELRAAESERGEAVREKEEWLRVLDGVIGGVRR
ncbi:RNA polymerase II mediator complex subunit [Toensbergia leucococca]|nr:RNA polymerase II mediator complex subunit [Toensbergia leucococca]